jgi:hypothetical protein
MMHIGGRTVQKKNVGVEHGLLFKTGGMMSENVARGRVW